MSDYADQTVAVLAVQGAFAEHEARLSELGAHCIELRQAADLKQDFDRLVLPGGESTVQGKLLDELGMLEELRARIVFYEIPYLIIDDITGDPVSLKACPSWAPAPA